MNVHFPSFPRFSHLATYFFVFVQMSVSWLSAQTIEVVGSASSTVNARIPVINDAGNVFYVNGGRYAIGNPAVPILKTNSTVSTLLAPGAGDTVPYVAQQ